jgi:tRNA threonylcarbamoyladenosine biosynthesis protein TsaE
VLKVAELKEISRWEGFSLEGLDAVASGLGAALPRRGVVAVHGPMGAGKTTLIRALLSHLGVREEGASPTFGLVHHHSATREGQPWEIRHMDLYRLEDEEEAERSGIAEMLQDRALNLVEWPERIPGLMPSDAWLLKVIPHSDGTRTCILWQLQE